MTTITTESVSPTRYEVECVTVEYEAAALPDGDIVEMVQVPKGAVIVELVVDYDAMGANTAITVGDGAAANRFITTTATTSAGIVRLLAGRGYKYTADDTIDIVNSSTGDATGTYRLTVWFYRDYR